MTYDFTFIYEVKLRELENILLLKYELENKGYRVKLLETWEQNRYRSKPVDTRVCVAFALYNDGTLAFMNSYLNGCKKFVNLQWEQIFTNGDKSHMNCSEGNTYGVTGLARQAVHICWGKNTSERLIEYFDVKPANAPITGHVALDFLRPEFNNYYTSRAELLSEYNIDDNCKIILFCGMRSVYNNYIIILP